MFLFLYKLLTGSSHFENFGLTSMVAVLKISQLLLVTEVGEDISSKVATPLRKMADLNLNFLMQTTFLSMLLAPSPVVSLDNSDQLKSQS